MITFENSQVDEQQVLSELIDGEGVVLVKNVYSQSQINEAREIVNKYADTQEQKETHFNAEAATADKIHLQQRVWNLFGKAKIFSDLISFISSLHVILGEVDK